MLFRKTDVKCSNCKRFEPDSKNPRKGRCHTVDIEDSDETRDCRWYEQKDLSESPDNEKQ